MMKLNCTVKIGLSPKDSASRKSDAVTVLVIWAPGAVCSSESGSTLRCLRQRASDIHQARCDDLWISLLTIIVPMLRFMDGLKKFVQNIEIHNDRLDDFLQTGLRYERLIT